MIASPVESPMWNALAEKVVTGGLPTIRFTRAELVAIVVPDRAANRKDCPACPKLVLSFNRQGMSLAGADCAFVDVTSQADIIHADGMSVVITSNSAVETGLLDFQF